MKTDWHDRRPLPTEWQGGAVDVFACRRRGWGGSCMHRKCAICGYGPHMAVHGLSSNGEIFGHEYQPEGEQEGEGV